VKSTSNFTGRKINIFQSSEMNKVRSLGISKWGHVMQSHISLPGQDFLRFARDKLTNVLSMTGIKNLKGDPKGPLLKFWLPGQDSNPASAGLTATRISIRSYMLLQKPKNASFFNLFFQLQCITSVQAFLEPNEPPRTFESFRSFGFLIG